MRKGQAAMEFLMTYGWAILVVLAAIGALAYFGVLSPDRFLPEKCTANPPFACTQYKVSVGGTPGDTTDDTVVFNIQNSVGTGVQFGDITLKCTSAATGYVFTAPAATVTPNGEAITVTYTLDGADLTASGCTALSEGARFKGTYDIVYTKEGETVSHAGSGTIQVRTEA